ncbi:hypothetical protein ACHAW5_003990 [Stephanodiscus triporus]|uniref:Peptidase M48 domain-containing protein n=1 Tax=Stephanodiscus triporus TaxID=2934178 RepID=A0ABD3MIW8_9STRA
MFNTYEPLPPGEVKDRIYALAVNYRHGRQQRSSHSNAFMFGFFKNKRIVLFDTLLKQVRSDEILAILGHELGHWKMGHTVTNFVISQLYTGAAFYTFSLCYSSHELYRAFGRRRRTTRANDHRPPPLLRTVWEPIDKRCEFETGRVLVELGMGRTLHAACARYTWRILAPCAPTRGTALYHYSHPAPGGEAVGDDEARRASPTRSVKKSL